MDLVMLVRLLARRWYVVAATMLVGGVAMVALAQAMEPAYSTSASVILVVPNPEDGDAGTATNPYVDFSGSLSTTTQIVADVVNSTQVRQEVAAAGLSPDYEVVPAERVPTLGISVEGSDADVVARTVPGLVEQAARTLNRLQEAARAPAAGRIAVSTLVPADEPQESTARTTRGLVVVGMLTIVAAVSLALLVEYLSRSARSRSRDGGAPLVSTGVDAPARPPEPDPVGGPSRFRR